MNAKQIPLVCIIMPVYNGENTIHYALNSIVRQTYENWICVIVNDGSTDRTKEILDSIEDKRFKIIHLSHNCGRGAARDEALNRAEGKYLAYLDADDMMHKDKIKAQVEFMESHPEIMLVSCGGITYNDKFEALCAFRIKVSNLSKSCDMVKLCHCCRQRQWQGLTAPKYSATIINLM